LELIKSEEKSESAAGPQPKVRSQTVPPKQRGQSVLRVIIIVVIAVVLFVAIVLLARWVYHKSHHKAQPAVATSQKTPASSSKQPTSGAQPASGNSSTTQPDSTPNTGPGNVVAIFVGSSLVAAGLHYIISVRRFSKNGV